MKNIITSIILLFCLISCSETKTTVTAYNGSGIHAKPIGTHIARNWLYGKFATENDLFENRTTSNLDTGFANLTKFATSLAGAYIEGSIQKAMEITKQMHDANLTSAQIAAVRAKAATDAAKISAGAAQNAKAIEGKLFTEGATLYKQPTL